MLIRVINPIIEDRFNEETEEEFAKYASEDTEIRVVNLDRGPASIESYYDEALAVPDILRKVEEAGEGGYSAVVINCMGDPGLEAAMEVSEIPVVGPARTSMLWASYLGQAFSIVSVLENVNPVLRDIAGSIGVEGNLSSIRSIDIPVLDLEDEEKLTNSLFEEILKCINEDGSHVLVLGCTGMMGVAEDLREMLGEGGYDVPLLYPVPISLKFAEGLVDLGLKQSKQTYMKPPRKKRKL